MLHQHALDRFFRKIGIDGLTAKGVEVVEAANEGRIPAAFFINSLLDGSGQLWNALGEIRNRVLPLLNVRSLVVEELVDDMDEGVGAGDVLVEDACPALVKNGALGSLENNVVARVALVELELDLLGKIVPFVFGFPIAVRQVVEIDERSVHDDGRAAGTLDPVLRDKRQLRLCSASGFRQQFLERAADGSLMIDVELAVLVKRLVVGLHRGVRRLERKGHASGGKA